MPGETTDQYNARQAQFLMLPFRLKLVEAKLREEARERLRQKFGNGSMSSAGGHGKELLGEAPGWFAPAARQWLHRPMMSSVRC